MTVPRRSPKRRRSRAWYVDARIAELETQTVFSRTWQVMGRVDQVAKPGQFVSATVAGEPLVAVRGNDGVLRAFYNVCRHHAAAVVTEPCGHASILHCPYHAGTTASTAPSRVCRVRWREELRTQRQRPLPVKVDTWEQFVFVNLDPAAAPLASFSWNRKARRSPRIEQAALLRHQEL